MINELAEGNQGSRRGPESSRPHVLLCKLGSCMQLPEVTRDKGLAWGFSESLGAWLRPCLSQEDLLHPLLPDWDGRWRAMCCA